MIITIILGITCILYSIKIHLKSKKNEETIEFSKVEFVLYFGLCAVLVLRMLLHTFNVLYCLF